METRRRNLSADALQESWDSSCSKLIKIITKLARKRKFFDALLFLVVRVGVHVLAAEKEILNFSRYNFKGFIGKFLSSSLGGP